MIISFGDTNTADLYHGRSTNRIRQFPPEIIKTALRKLDMINSAGNLGDLSQPPGNRLQAMQGNLSGLHSVRVNEQRRVIFRWKENNAHDVVLTDYH